MDLLAAHGFNDFRCYDDFLWDGYWEADDHILREDDPKGLKVLLENGYVFSDLPFYRKYYELYVLDRPQVKRKTIGLDNWKFKESVPEPKYEAEPWIFGRKEAKERNARRYEDYEDRVRAHSEFVQSFDSRKLDGYRRKKADSNKQLIKAMDSALRSFERGGRL